MYIPSNKKLFKLKRDQVFVQTVVSEKFLWKTTDRKFYFCVTLVEKNLPIPFFYDVEAEIGHPPFLGSSAILGSLEGESSQSFLSIQNPKLNYQI